MIQMISERFTEILSMPHWLFVLGQILMFISGSFAEFVCVSRPLSKKLKYYEKVNINEKGD